MATILKFYLFTVLAIVSVNIVYVMGYRAALEVF